ncbi:MAG: transposase [Burkholderiales bacterium]|nr:transposase [Burkholderiales bacterium]MBS0415960.1 transposase [Pseudomonadota bacterium]
MATEIVRRRRHYSAELKEKVLLECAQPGPSVSMVAMAYGINANTPWWKTPGSCPCSRRSRTSWRTRSGASCCRRSPTKA